MSFATLLFSITISLSAMTTADLPNESNSSSYDSVLAFMAYAFYKSGHYQQAHEQWLILAEKGNVSAMNNLANLYQQGQGVAVDLNQALFWWQRAAELGDTIGQLNLALALLQQQPAQVELAQNWLTKAAEQGDMDAQYHLAVLLLKQNSPESQALAEHWLQKAIQQNQANARHLWQQLQQQK